mgnify:CR=1 FL=1
MDGQIEVQYAVLSLCMIAVEDGRPQIDCGTIIIIITMWTFCHFYDKPINVPENKNISLRLNYSWPLRKIRKSLAVEDGLNTKTSQHRACFVLLLETCM